MPQGKDFRLRLIIHQRQHVYGVADLQLRLFQQMIQHDLRQRIAFQFNDDSHAVAVGLVSQIRNPFDSLVFDKRCDRSNQLSLIYLVRQLRNDDAAALFLAVFLNFRLRPQQNLSPAGSVRLPDACSSHNNSAGREIRSRDASHKICQRGVGVIQHQNTGIDYFF